MKGCFNQRDGNAPSFQMQDMMVNGSTIDYTSETLMPWENGMSCRVVSCRVVSCYDSAMMCMMTYTYLLTDNCYREDV